MDQTSDQQAPAGSDAGGIASRRLAYTAVMETLKRRVPLDDVLEELGRADPLPARDEALARAIAIVTFRRLGTIRRAVEARVDRKTRDERLVLLLAIGAAQVLFLDVPDHAAVDTTIRLAQEDHRLRHAGGLVNAVLRRMVREREAILAGIDPTADAPAWLLDRWTARYGEAIASRIAEAHRVPASLDLTVKDDAAGWAERLQGLLLPTGSIRIPARTAVRDLPGFADGAWWVQDAAAALPARLLAVKPGERVADFCAAPGGKTAQLAAASAEIVAVDRSAKRLARLTENLERLKLTAETRVADATILDAPPFDAILLDAPCSATGTLRRHPDVAWTKDEMDVRRLADLQRRLLDAAARLLRPGGRLVYCTCSLEPEEGEEQAASFLARHPDFARAPVTADEVGGLTDLVSPAGDLRTLPFHLSVDGARGGLDGFFAARFVRSPD